MADRNGGDPAVMKDWLELPSVEGTSNRSSDTLSSDRTLTPLSSSTSVHTSSGEQPKRMAENSDSTIESRQASKFSEHPFITLNSTGASLQESLASPSTTSTQRTNLPSSANTSSARSPSSSATSFFSNFRPSSPKIQLPHQPSTSTSTRDDAASFYSTTTPTARKGLERERDMSLSGSETSSRNRRPSSVLEHVGGMLDRFGRRLQSRGESDRRRLSSSMLGLNGSAVDVGESESSVDGNSPNESSMHMSHTASQPPNWDRTNASSATNDVARGDRGPGLSWSPVLDEGHRSRPDIRRNESAGSSNGEGSRLTVASSSSLRAPTKRLSVMERTLIQVTEDNEQFSVVDISGLNSAAAIKERMMSKLHLFEEDPASFAMSRTEIGQSGPGGPTLNSDELLAVCWQEGDEKGTLKFLLHQISPPSHPNHSMLPPPQSSNLSPKLQTREVPNDYLSNGGTTIAPSHVRTGHSKSGSFSSRSSVGDVLGYGDSAGAGDSGSDASGRLGALHRVRATNRRTGAAGSASSTDDTRSPIVSTRSPSQPSTPLLSSVVELETKEKELTPVTVSSKRSSRPERSDRRSGQSPSRSPIEEEIGQQDLQSSSRPGASRRSANSRPSSSHTTARTSLHSQGESDNGAPSARSSQGATAPRSPITSQNILPERRASDKSPSQPPPGSVDDRSAIHLPKSLQPGARDPRAIDAADAAHMYLGGSSSPLDESVYASPSGSNRDERLHQQTALGMHNARSVDDMRRRSRALMLSSLPEMPPFGNGHPSSRIPSSAGGSLITRQGSADAGYRPNPTYGQSSNYDPRSGGPFTGVPGRPRTSAGPERERALSVPAEPIYQQLPIMVGRPSGGNTGFEVVRSTTAPRPEIFASPPMPRPMGPHSLHPHHHDNRPFVPSSQPSPRVVPYSIEFGARSPHMQGPPVHQQHHTMDPRMMSPRPATFHDHPRYRPVALLPGHNRPNPVSQTHREDPFIASNFPASSSRTVSEFQRNPSSALQPGMTVQETMQKQRQQVMNQFAAAAPLPRGLDSRDVRSTTIRPLSRNADFSPHVTSLHAPASMHGYRPPLTQQQQQQQQQQQYNQHALSPVGNYHPPSRQQPATVPSSARPSSSNNPPIMVPPTRPHTAALDEWEAPTERSSGSSFTTISSRHRRNLSSEDRHSTGWVEEPYSAPTSARSSRSESLGQDRKASVVAVESSTNAPRNSILADSELPYSGSSGSGLQHRDSLADEDLVHLRPLPKVPPHLMEFEEVTGRQGKSTVFEETKDDNDNTLRAAEWRKMLISMEAEGEDGDESGTAKASKHSDLLSPRRSETNESESSGTSHRTAVPIGKDAIEGGDDQEGTFNSFASFDDEDDYDGGGTWAQPLDDLPRSSKGEMTTRDKPTSPVADEAATLRPGNDFASPGNTSRLPGTSPRRPVLTLSIDPSVNGSPSLVQNPSPTPRSVSSNVELHNRLNSTLASPQPVSTLAMPSPSSTDINRRTSFARREVDWAFRPPPELLYDNLDAFFPKHDLDKPVLENSTLPSSPQALSPKTEVPASSPAPLSTNRARFTHKKSIRIVAQDRKKFLERTEASERRKAEGEGLARRRSTKLWGTKVVEVTPAGAPTSSASSAGTDSPLSETGARPVFKWVKGDLIGKGTYGRVYLALNATTGEMIAVKQVELPTTESDREDARQKGVVSALKSEIETLKDLDHPNIVSYLGFEETTSYLSIFLEYVPGGSVGSCLRKHGKLDEATIKSFLQQILVGLNYLHNRGILHRDLKADNLLVDFNGIVKISDFGTVRKSEDIYGNIASMSIQGSIFWMAPEVVSLSRAGYSAKVDIWSLGCVVLEMFAGRRPWSDEEAVQAMFKIGAERKPPPIPPDAILSRPATHFLKVCFAVDPASRPTAQRLLEHVFPHPEPGWVFSDSSLYRALHR